MDHQLEKIKSAASGLFYMSETDAPLDAVEFPETTRNEIMQKIKKSSSSGDHLEEQTLDYFFRNQVKEYPEHSEEDKGRTKKFKALLETLKENLSDVHVYRVGSIQIDAYIIGKLKSGKYAGLKTKLVET
jgi:predicted HAD superfamily phosphohydrolase